MWGGKGWLERKRKVRKENFFFSHKKENQGPDFSIMSAACLYVSGPLGSLELGGLLV